METIRKNRLLFWILIFLVVVNLSALASYFFFPRMTSQAGCDGEPCTMDQAYRSELGLTDSQMRQVEQINKEYRAISAPLAESIRARRGEIVDLLSAPSPDTTAIDRFSEELAGLQRSLHRENLRHYLQLKQVCDHEQALRLSNLYRELYGCPMQGQGKGMQHRYRRGW